MGQSFIRDHDFKSSIRDEHLDAITQNDDTIVADSIAASETEIKSYLRGKYDIGKLFPVIGDHDPAVAYLDGDIVHDSSAAGTYYVANGDIAISTPLSDPKWVEGDPRDKLIIEFMVDLILYRIHSRVAPQQIPSHRIIRRDDAIAFLKRAAKYDVTVGWDQDVDTEPSSITWGSNSKNEKHF